MTNSEFCVTRERHLDHMVKVVPFIVGAYAIQCYFIMQMGPLGFAVDGLFFLGGCLVAMIFGFIAYDLTHAVNFNSDSFTVSISWLKYSKTVSYQELAQIDVSEPGQSFATLTLQTKSGKKFGFYFVDDADKIKKWLEQKRSIELLSAA